MSNLNDHLINPQECQSLSKEYAKSNYVEINKSRPASKPDSTSYNIDLSVLQDYLKLISDEMEKRGIRSKGVKVCMGKYPEKSSDPKLNPQFLGYQMIYFSPVDLGKEAELKNDAAPQDAASNMDDVPNLNYMGLCPPN